MGVDGNIPEAPPPDRVPLLVVLDRSKAMVGDPIAYALAGISRLVARLSPDDRIGLVAFNGKVVHPAPPAPIGNGDYLNAVLSQIEPRRGADLSAALEQGVGECLADGKTCRMAVISVGRPTQGLRSRRQLERITAEGLRRGVRTSTIAVGTGADRDLMAAISAAGGGWSAVAESAAGVGRELERLTLSCSRDQ